METSARRLVFKRFTLFERDDRRSFKDCFQQRLIFYKAPLFRQYLFNIFNSLGRLEACFDVQDGVFFESFLLKHCGIEESYFVL